MPPPTTIDNTKFFRLNFQESLERFFFKRSIIEPYKIFNLEDTFERSIIEQIQYNDPREQYAHVEPLGKGLVQLWHSDDWRKHYENLMAEKAKQDLLKRQHNAHRELIQKIAPKLKGFMPVVDDKTVQVIIDQLIAIKDNPAIEPLLKIYGITKEELIVVVEPIKDNTLTDQQLIDQQLKEKTEEKLEQCKSDITRLIATGFTQQAIKDGLVSNGYGMFSNHPIIQEMIKHANK